jgi:hypothetical protein
MRDCGHCRGVPTPPTPDCVRAHRGALFGDAALQGGSRWGAAVLALALACGGRLGGGDVDSGSGNDAIAPVGVSSSVGTPSGSSPSETHGSSSSSSATAPSSSGRSTGAAPSGAGGASPSAGTNCMPRVNSESATNGRCESMMVNDCDGTRYQVTCSCPQQQCTCFERSTMIIPFGGCPYCPSMGPGPQAPGGPSISDLFAACGYPH